MKEIYLTKNEAELKTLQKNYEKLISCYEIKTEFSDIMITQGKLTDVIIKPRKQIDAISVTKKENIDQIIQKIMQQKNEDFCPTCAPNHYENMQAAYCELGIVGTSYKIELIGYNDY